MAATKVKKRRSGAKAFRKKSTPVERAYARAVQLSRQTGKEVRFVVDIRPDGAESVSAFAEDAASFAGPRRADARHSELDRALADARRRGQLRVVEVLAGPEMLSADAQSLWSPDVTMGALCVRCTDGQLEPFGKFWLP